MTGFAGGGVIGGFDGVEWPTCDMVVMAVDEFWVVVSIAFHKGLQIKGTGQLRRKREIRQRVKRFTYLCSSIAVAFTSFTYAGRPDVSLCETMASSRLLQKEYCNNLEKR